MYFLLSQGQRPLVVHKEGPGEMRKNRKPQANPISNLTTKIELVPRFLSKLLFRGSNCNIGEEVRLIITLTVPNPEQTVFLFSH